VITLKFLKFIVSIIIGGFLIYLINKLGKTIGLHIGLNAVTSATIGVLGAPGALLLLAIKKF
jgi:inhibitor of the pro-sigma K processing machinery